MIPGSRNRESFYLWIAIAMSVTAFLGFSFTYFGPLYRGEYPRVSPTVHVHGWSFFAWYLLLPAQAALIRATQVKVHRALGISSAVLAAIMVVAGLIVVGVRVDRALAPGGCAFWAFMGLPIFSTLLLFAVFYAAAIRLRRRGDAHKRLMLLASASALGAATFRIFVAIFGFEPRVWIAGLLAPNLLIFAAMAHDYRREQKIHPVYRYGLPLTLGLEGGMILLVITPRGDIVKQGLAWVGRLLGPLY